MNETHVIRVRYWASAKAAAGLAEEDIDVTGPLSLSEVHAAVVARHPGQRFADVVRACSVLVGDRPASASDPTEVLVHPGEVVEFLPPFAGG